MRMLKAPQTLETARLRLRRPALADAPALYEYTRDPEATRFMNWPVHRELRETIEFLQRCAPRWESGEEYCWGLGLKPDDVAIGTIGTRVRGREADLGYIINRVYWGHGYTTEAAHAVLAWLSGIETMQRIWATCDVENVASTRVLEKLGLKRKEVLRGYILRPNLSPQPRDSFLYEKLLGAAEEALPRGDRKPPASLRIEPLSDHVDLIPQIARWHFEQWGELTGFASLALYENHLRASVQGDSLPLVLVASTESGLAGSVSLVACDMQSRAELTPWLAQLFVKPGARSLGIGEALVRAAAAHCATMGFPMLYLYTSGTLPAFYSRLGWTVREVTDYLGKQRTVMELYVKGLGGDA
jgi:ribosomal-protein-alanine N-acetyltransferase